MTSTLLALGLVEAVLEPALGPVLQEVIREHIAEAGAKGELRLHDLTAWLQQLLAQGISTPFHSRYPFSECFTKVGIPAQGCPEAPWVRGLPVTKYRAEEEQAL